MANERIVSKPVEVPDVDEDATPMERLIAFARRIVNVPKDKIDEQDKPDKKNRATS